MKDLSELSFDSFSSIETILHYFITIAAWLDGETMSRWERVWGFDSGPVSD